nr:MBOAT family protein [Lachnospiraceae bacterium]
MLFNSLSFLVFFPIVVMVYFLIPARIRYIWLLVASYYFYMSWNPVYALLLLFSTGVTYLCALILEQVREDKALSVGCMSLSLILNFSILAVFKYYDFFLENINRILNRLHLTLAAPDLDLLLPVGISFYIFQAVGYTVDVYRGDIQAERNPLRYALFVSFFPQLVAGPIERSGRLLKQLRELDHRKHIFSPEQIESGILIMVFGYFQKMVIADRVAIFVDAIFNSYMEHTGLILILASLGFTLQIYTDFAGYSNIAIGAARIMGFDLMQNFNCPYFSVSIKDFWSRWHISLSTWFRDYLYFPLGGSRNEGHVPFLRKVLKYRNILIVFLLSGLWHGASWHYVFWGFLHGVYRVVGEITLPLREKLVQITRIRSDAPSFKALRMLITFILVVIAWVFFRANHVSDGIDILKRAVSTFDPWILSDGSLYNFGLDLYDFRVLFLSVLILLITSCFTYRKISLVR